MVKSLNCTSINVSLANAQAEYLESCADATGKSLSALVRWALGQAVPGFADIPDPPQSHRSRRSARRRKGSRVTANVAARALAELRGQQ